MKASLRPEFYNRISQVIVFNSLAENELQRIVSIYLDRLGKKLRDERRYSTALSAPINYGPGLKMLGWVERHSKYPGVLIPTDLAGPALSRVRAPTLLIVGGDDLPVIEMNRVARAQLQVETRMDIVPGATHLFEEPGALEQVAQLAADWFGTHLGRLTARAA